MDTKNIEEKAVNNDKGLSKYEKGGNAGIEGVLFQVGLSAVVFLNAFEKFTGWKLSTENKRCGKFDDVVLELPDGVILLQAKHRKNKITFNDLLSTNTKHDDFSLAKYFLSYQEIKTRFQVKYVVICTNADINIDKSNTKFLNERKDESEKSIVYHQGCSFCTFDFEILPTLEKHIRSYYGNLKRKNVEEDVITTDNIKDFLNHLRLYASYPSEERLNTIIEQIFTGMKYTRDLCIKIPSKYVHDKVLEWFRQHKGVHLEEYHFKAMISEIRSYEYCKELAKYDVHFRNVMLNFTDTKRILHLVPPKTYYLLTILKIYRALHFNDKILYVSQEDCSTLLSQAIEAFKLPKYTHLVVIWSHIKEEAATYEINSKLRQILNKKSYKKVILIAASNNKLAEQLAVKNDMYTVAEECVTFKDLSVDTQSKIIKNKNIFFQGNDISLEELFPTEVVETYEQAINVEMLERIIRKKKVKMGSAIQLFDEDIARYYIYRNFKRQINSTETYQKRVEVLSEKDIYHVQDKLVLIADSAGMGKSTVLANLAVTIKKQFPYLWVFRVELNSYTKALKEFQEKKYNANITELLRLIDTTQLANQFEIFTFSTASRVILMLDGLDEVSPYYTELVLNLLAQCREASNIRKIFVTCRQHVVEELKKKITVEPFTLEPFTETNQIDFLTNYWMHNLDLDDSKKGKCEEYSKALITKMSSWIKTAGGENHFTAVPLQVRMLSEIFQEGNNIEDSADWKGCKEYVQGEDVEPNLPEKMNVVKLYAMFVKSKKDIFITKGNLSHNAIANQALDKVFEESLVCHRMLALELILNKTQCECIPCYRESRGYSETDILKIGIIQKFDKSVQFIHRTFAEYFVAEILLMELKKQKKNPSREYQQFFIDGILYYNEFNVVRIFIDNFLQSGTYSLPCDTFRSYKSLTYKINLHAVPHVNFIHEMARQGCLGILQLILKCINFRIIRHREVKNTYHSSIVLRNPKLLFGRTLNFMEYLVGKGGMNIKDSWGDTPLHSAVANGQLKMVKFLVEHGVNVNAKNSDGDTALTVATYDLIKDDNFLRYMVDNGADVNIIGSDNNTPLHVATKYRNWDAAQYFVQHGAKVNIRDNKGYTVLHFAIIRGRYVELKYFMEHGSDVSIKFANEGDTNDSNYDSIFHCLCDLWGHSGQTYSGLPIEKYCRDVSSTSTHINSFARIQRLNDLVEIDLVLWKASNRIQQNVDLNSAKAHNK